MDEGIETEGDKEIGENRERERGGGNRKIDRQRGRQRDIEKQRNCGT